MTHFKLQAKQNGKIENIIKYFLGRKSVLIYKLPEDSKKKY